MSTRTFLRRTILGGTGLLALLAATASAGVYDLAGGRLETSGVLFAGPAVDAVPADRPFSFDEESFTLKASDWALAGGLPDFGGAGAEVSGSGAVRPALILAAAPESADIPTLVTELLPAGFVYPEVTGLETPGPGKVAVPPSGMAGFAMGPTGMSTVLVGEPEGADGWASAGTTALSYVRPHVNVQMTLSLGMPGSPAGDGFEGGGLDSSARLAVGHRTRVHSSQVGSRTSQFGNLPPPTPPQEPETAVATGLDLGILPTFLSQMGLNVSVVVSRGAETGDLNLSLVGTSGVPTDWAPGQPPTDNPVGVPVNPLAQGPGPAFNFSSSSVSGGGLGAGFFGAFGPFGPQPFPIFPEPGPTPITPEGPGGEGEEPVIPEPATLLLVAGGAVGVLLGRRGGSRSA